MIAKTLIERIRKTNGPILVEVSNFDDVFWIQTVKRDLINMLQQFYTNEETGFEIDDNGYFSKDFKVS